jgi:site-specific DNA-methyltransferase (adenine-specific)
MTPSIRRWVALKAGAAMLLNRIINTDCETGMRSLSNNIIPLTVTSPPYDTLRIYGSHDFNFEKIAVELYRITMPGGVVVWVVQEQIVDGSEKHLDRAD